MGIEVKGTSPILHGKINVNRKQKHPVKDFPEEAEAFKKAGGPGKLRQRSLKKGGKV
mgnify:CR=1 FL=1